MHVCDLYGKLSPSPSQAISTLWVLLWVTSPLGESEASGAEKMQPLHDTHYECMCASMHMEGYRIVCSMYIAA